MNKQAKYGWLVFFLVLIIVIILFLWAFTGNVIGPIDSDGDGLSDEEEEEIGTDPSNSNTDRDRYLDGNDPNPLKINNANVQFELIEKNWDWDVTNIALLFLGRALVDSETVLADAETTIKVYNLGDDYSEYVNFDVIFEVSNTEIRRVPDSLGRINFGEKRTRSYHEQILLKDIPDLLLNLVTEQTTDWNIKIENLNYERFG